MVSGKWRVSSGEWEVESKDSNHHSLSSECS